MTTSVKVTLDTRSNSRKENGTYPVILRLKHKGSNRTICSLEHCATKEDWDPTNQGLKRAYKQVSNVTRTNNFFIKRRTLANDVINELRDTKELEEVSINELKELILKRIFGNEAQKKIRKTIERKPLEWNYCKEQYLKYMSNIDVPRHKQRTRARNYVKDTARYLQRFEDFLQSETRTEKVTKVSQITDKIVGMYFEHVEKITNSNSSFNHHFRAIRGLYNYLIEDLDYQIKNPFKKVALKYEGTIPKSISKTEFEQLMELISPEDSFIVYKTGERKNMYRPYLKSAYRLTLYTGRRTEEIVSLKWSNVKCDETGEPMYIESIDLKANRQSNHNQSRKNKMVFIPVIPQLKELLYEMGFEKYQNSDTYLIAPDEKSTRKSIIDKLSKGFTFFYKKLNTGKEISLKHLRKTYLTHLQIVTGNAIAVSGHSSESILDDHYIDKVEIARNVAKSNISIFG